MKKILILLLSSILVFSNTSCDSYLDVNQNQDAPDYVDAYLRLAPICQEMQGIYYDIRALGPLTQMMGTTGYTSYAHHSYATNSDAAGEYWRVAYFLHGINLENLINQCLEKEEYAFAGIGLIIKAFDWDLITKYHGDIPYFSKYIDGLTTFPYDYQKDIYPDIRKLARKGIEYIEMEEADLAKYGRLISDNDYIYHGDMDKWKKFAYAILARNYISLSNKNDFVSSGFADSVIYCVEHSFASMADDATLKSASEGTDIPDVTHWNCWGTYRGFLGNSYFQHQFAVQTLSGTVPLRDENTGYKIKNDDASAHVQLWYPYKLNPVQRISDTVRSEDGHLDPRIAVLLGFEEKRYADYKITDTMDVITSTPNPGVDDNYLYDTVRLPYTEVFTTEKDYVKYYMSKRFLGGGFTSREQGIVTVYYDEKRHYAPAFQGKTMDTPTNETTIGAGRWLYRDGAPYIISTFAEMKFCAAEAYWKKGDKSGALQAMKDGIAAHMDFCENYITPPANQEDLGGDKITKATFRSLANEYLAGPYVGGLTASDLTLSHIMMQKWVTLYPWGAHEAWVDMRKYHYDIQYTGDYPKNGNGWTIDRVDQKWDSDPAKVYLGLFLYPTKAYAEDYYQNRYNLNNGGSPCYRIRPRYNSEYLWNIPSLELLKPISGNAPNYHCSIPWFAFPGDMPESL
ncbi:MAG: SusD/RagB family nutrient-binding outer membrane lipoprotein [Prevotellaceae bacterium]|jgi:hypothetical protein|nr:SusD/RagB family nutrient-binding outer membrane lipoprotein [Prevotellaceae bacterium]